MGKITFVLGGARSGKSSYALKLVENFDDDKIGFIATCPYYDEEMEERIALHKQERPAEWKTFEEFYDLAPLINKINGSLSLGIVIIDCITLFTSNLLIKNLKEDDIKVKVKNMIEALKNAKYDSVLVANEVGLGIIPENKLAREFRDVAGRVNQQIAAAADEVFFTVAGIPTKIK